MQTRNITYLALITAGILLIPLLAMQFTSEVNWTRSDFVIAGVLIFGTGLAYVFGTVLLRNSSQRVIFGIVLAIASLLIWAELAVGLFGTPWAGS